MKTVLEEIIEQLLVNSKYLSGENDSKTARIVGQYLKNIANDFQENYLQKEKEQITQAYDSAAISWSDTVIDNGDAKEWSEKYFNNTYNKSSK